MKVLPLAHFRIEPSAFSSGEVTNDVPQMPLNAKSCPEVKGLGSSDGQEFKPQLCCSPAMGLVGQLSPQRWRPEGRSKDGGRPRPEQSTQLCGGCWGTVTWWHHPLPPAHSPLPTPLHLFLLFPNSFPGCARAHTDSCLLHHLCVWGPLGSLCPSLLHTLLTVSLFTGSLPVRLTINST